MHSLEPELHQLHTAGAIDDATTARAIARERGEVLSLFQELRLTLYVGVALLAAGAGLLLKDRLAQLGPRTLCALVALAAAACYATAIRSALRQRNRSLAGDYILLLGALLLSADLAFMEYQFHWLDGHWSLHLLLLAVLHAAAAYAFDSRLLLSLALTSFAAWFSVETRAHAWLGDPRGALETGARGLACALVIWSWSLIDRRLARRPGFPLVLRHFAVNIACWGALAWCFGDATRWGGLTLLVLITALAVRDGLHAGDALGVVYGVLYGALGVGYVAGAVTGAINPLLSAFVVLGITLGAARLLWRLRLRLRERSSA